MHYFNSVFRKFQGQKPRLLLKFFKFYGVRFIPLLLTTYGRLNQNHIDKPIFQDITKKFRIGNFEHYDAPLGQTTGEKH